MRRAGFSLIELSIVLVILGLLTGGVLSGQTLIRASELRAVTTELQRYSTAIGAFKDKYQALPGDFAQVADFGWTDAAGTTVDPVAAGSGTLGNGTIDISGTIGRNEASLFWIELSNAGLIEGRYTLINNSSFTPGTHCPRSKLTNAAWNVFNNGNIANTDTTFYEGNYGNVFVFGASSNSISFKSPSGTPAVGVLRTEEAWNIDTKIDDGVPHRGVVTTFESQGSATAGSRCGNAAASATNTATTAYDLTNTSATACSLIIRTNY